MVWFSSNRGFAIKKTKPDCMFSSLFSGTKIGPFSPHKIGPTHAVRFGLVRYNSSSGFLNTPNFATHTDARGSAHTGQNKARINMLPIIFFTKGQHYRE